MIIGGQYIIEGLYSVFMYCPGSKEANRKYSGGGSVNNVTTIRQKKKENILTEWKLKSIVDFADHTLYTKRQSSLI